VGDDVDTWRLWRLVEAVELTTSKTSTNLHNAQA